MITVVTQKLCKVKLLTNVTKSTYLRGMQPYQTRSIKETREQLSQLVEEVAIAKKRYLITKFGKPKAMIIPIPKTPKKERFSGLEASFGLWKNRKDIQDSAKWVANLRRRTRSRYGKIFS